MDLVTGALGILPFKLLELLKEEYNLQKGVKAQVESLRWELESMHAALRKVAEFPWDQLDEQVKVWACEVREASYDMEDILDTFLVRVDGCREPTDASGLKRAMKKMGNLLSKGKSRRDIAGAIDDLSKQVREMAERRARYRVDDLVAKPAATSIDPRLSALYTKVSQLIGVNEPRDKLIKMLSIGDDCVSETRIVSVVGFGGLGKTTLARAVYESFTNDDYVKAFVPVGRNPDLRKVFRDILIQLDNHCYMMEFNLTTLDEIQLIHKIREFLKDKRYFIVIDDIWDVPSWNTIRCALDDNNLRSKIVITTRNHVVAEKVCCSYKMEPLPHESSRRLFFARIFGSESKCPRQFLDISEILLRKCGGVPLAIITISSLLANKLGNTKEWYELSDSIGSGLGSNHDMDNMRKILSLSYYDLPSHLKTCLLYISIFPEDCHIWRDRLIWRWIAEDFVHYEKEGHSLFELGMSYFNELVNRSLIQPVQMDADGMPWIFCVHDMVLDLICFLSREENFVTTVSGDSKKYTHCSQIKARRLSLRSTSTWPRMNMSKLRSITISSPAITNLMLPFSCYHLLRVLDLDGCSLKDHQSLKFFGNLCNLRYLRLWRTSYAGELPVEIRKLQFLQTLNLNGTCIKELPSSIGALRQLMCLYVEESTRLPNGLRNLTSLQVLMSVSVDSAYIAEELGHLIQLRQLWVKLEILDECICNALVESLGKLHRIQTILVTSYYEAANLEGSMESLIISNLRHLYIQQTSWLPKWINPISLPLLSYLNIVVALVQREDIRVLGMLQALRHLEVQVSGGIQALERFVVGADAFPCARVCRFFGISTMPSMFPPGAMPRLEEFELCVQLEHFSRDGFTVDDLALGHLPSLQRAGVHLVGMEKVNEEAAMKVKEKLMHEANVHTNHPRLCFIQ